jgi:hypothetical protein
MIKKDGIEKDAGGSGRGLFQGTVPQFAWSHRKITTNLRIVCITVEIGARHFQNAGQKLCLLKCKCKAKVIPILTWPTLRACEGVEVKLHLNLISALDEDECQLQDSISYPPREGGEDSSVQ